jgi:hypothetical protein
MAGKSGEQTLQGEGKLSRKKKELTTGVLPGGQRSMKPSFVNTSAQE